MQNKLIHCDFLKKSQDNIYKVKQQIPTVEKKTVNNVLF